MASTSGGGVDAVGSERDIAVLAEDGVGPLGAKHGEALHEDGPGQGGLDDVVDIPALGRDPRVRLLLAVVGEELGAPRGPTFPPCPACVSRANRIG